jgi:UDP-N-acetylmuramate dehydrogenase
MSTATAETYLRESGLDVKSRVLIAPFTTLKVGGAADLFLEPTSIEQVRAIASCSLPFRVLGCGANLLVRDEGVRGIVLRLSKLKKRSGLYVESGMSLTRLIKETVSEGLSGLECLAGVPASVGGAIYMNAGGKHGEICDSVRFVDVFHEGEVERLTREEVGFQYRSTSLGDRIVLGVEFDLKPLSDVKDRYDEILAGKKSTQPLGSPNAGCMFKNPPGESAGKLIQDSGLCGARVNQVHVSQKHANFMINDGGASSDDVLRLVDLVQNGVRKSFGIDLKLEVQIW